MNWGALLEEIRTVDIDDAGETPKFSDKALYAYLRAAIGDYSQFLPLRRIDVVLEQDIENPKKFALPAGFLSELTVACPAGNLLEPRRGRLGAKVNPGNRAFFYTIENNTALYLDADPGEEEVILTYEAQHPLPANETDTEFNFTIPLADIELIKLYIIAKVNTKLRNNQSKLDRFKLAGTRTDNPIEEEVEDFFAEYKEKLVQRIPSKSVTLHRPRRFK